MRLPIRSEDDAFLIVCSLIAATALAAVVGWVAGTLAGVAAFTVLVALAVIWEVRSEDPLRGSRLRDAQRAGHDADRGRRTLLVAAAAVSGDRDDILPDREPAPTIEILAPVLQSRTHFFTTDIDHEREDARRRLATTLAWARERGFEAHGHVGDPIDPIAGLADELRSFDIDQLIVATLPTARAGWIELGMLEHLRDDLDLPLTHVVIDDGASSPIASADQQVTTR